MGLLRSRVLRWSLVGLALAGAGLALAVLVAWSGLINISASAGHPEPMEKFLELALRGSVRNHSSNLVPPQDLDSDARLRLGAAHFAGGCAECHGEPGRARNPIYDYMVPVPPDLAMLAPTWSVREQFFIVRHGLQFTGMPEWSGDERPDEVWSMVAFLQRLPELVPSAYRALAAGNAEVSAARELHEVHGSGVAELARTACDRCHDTATAPPPSALVPRLAGQNAAYLARSLREYKRGERRSGFMQPVAAMLDDAQIEALAAHYADMPRAPDNDPAAVLPATELAEAAALANGAHTDVRLPACHSCHGASARNDYPLLAGQYADYLAQQLRLFQRGGRKQSAWGEVMTAIARRLSAAQVDLLARWFAQQAAPDEED